MRAHFPEQRLVIEPMDNPFSKKNSEVRSPSLSGFSITMLHVFTSCGQFNNKFTSVIINSTHYLFSDWPVAYSLFSKSVPGRSFICRSYNNHGKGHSRSRAIMSCMTGVHDF